MPADSSDARARTPFARSLLKRMRQIRRILRPDLPQRFLPEPRRLARSARQQQSYLSRYSAYLEWLQCSSNAPSAPAHLTFYPIAKTLRSIGTVLHDGVEAGSKVVIAPGNPREEALLKATGRGDWKPWLWSRIPRGQLDNIASAIDDSTRSWPTFFVPLDRYASPPNSNGCTKPVWPLRGRLRSKNILEIAACTRYAFRLNAHMQALIDNYAREMSWCEAEPKLAIHLRRGDAASEDLRKQTRKSWPIEKYLQLADRICRRYRLSTIYLSTESQSEIAKAKALLPDYRILSLGHDRSIFPTIAKTNIFIEDMALKDASTIEPLVNSALADLFFIMRCKAFIGAFNSEFSILGWLLCIGENGYMVPYVDVVPKSRLEPYQGRLELRLDWLITQFYGDLGLPKSR